MTMIVIEINKNSSDSEGGSILLKKVLIYKYIFFEKNHKLHLSQAVDLQMKERMNDCIGRQHGAYL